MLNAKEGMVISANEWGCSIQSNGVLRSLRCFRSYRSFGSLISNRYCCLLSLLDPFGFIGL